MAEKEYACDSCGSPLSKSGYYTAKKRGYCRQCKNTQGGGEKETLQSVPIPSVSSVKEETSPSPPVEDTVIDEYDAVIGKARKAMQSSTDGQQAQLSQYSDIIDALSQRAKINLEDMTAAKKELIASDEKYNEATLAGMMTFVINVDKEISTQSDLLHSSTKSVANM